MVWQRSWYVIKNADQLGSVQFAPQQVLHPFLLAALAVALGHDLIGARQDGPSDPSDRIWDAFPSTRFELPVRFARSFQRVEHVEPLRTATSFHLGVADRL
mmetsp:Transcript_12283/g.16660  ORF Transcript_12283/g.16660 Transcript_12283/m.16660 type:complete len:101 (+) Transcript_12283:662-964(+)